MIFLLIEEYYLIIALDVIKDDEVKRELAKGNTLINYIEISTTIRELINKINYIFYSIW